MDFQYSEEQVAISSLANDLFADFCSDEQLLAFTESGNTWMEAVWSAVQETGLNSLFIPESLGGSGLGMQELMVVLVAQGRHLAQVPLWRNQVAIALLERYLPAELQGLLAMAASGESQITLATAQHCQARGLTLALNNQGQVDGVAHAVPDVDKSRYALLPAQSGEEVILVLVDLAHSHVKQEHGQLPYGGTVADIKCEALEALVVLPKEVWLELNMLSIACLAAIQLGLSERQLERTVDYVSERVQFDRAIGSFQAVQMSLADCHIAKEALKSCLWQLCYRLDAELPAEAESLATAYHACETGHIVGHKAQHVHGGFGVDVSYPIYRYLYWSREISTSLGGSRALLEELGNWLSDNDVLGWKYDLE